MSEASLADSGKLTLFEGILPKLLLMVEKQAKKDEGILARRYSDHYKEKQFLILLRH